MADVSTVSSQMDAMVAQYQETLSQPVYKLQDQQSTLNNQLSALSQLKSKLGALSTDVTNFAIGGTASPLLTYAVNSSNTSYMTATATAAAVQGSHSLKVSQLASNDTLLSNLIASSSESGLTANTDYSFSMGVGSADARALTVHVTGTTNNDVLHALADAVNNDSVLNQTMTATVIKISSTQSRLVFTAKNSGASNAITSIAGDFNSVLGLDGVDFTNRTASTSSAAGFVKSGNAAEVLNSKFAVDGIDIVRETNDIDDVVPGVTFSLKAPQADTDSPLSMQVAVDKDTVKKQIQQFITDYNGVMTYLQTNTQSDPTTKARGTLSSDPSAVSLRSILRQMVGGAVGGVKSGYPSTLSGIGITIGSDGQLSLSDSATLDSALTTDIHKVADLFTNAAGNGIADIMKTRLDQYTSYGGSIASESYGISQQVQDITDRITAMNAQIAKKADDYRTQFAEIQVLIDQASRTSQFVSTFASG